MKHKDIEITLSEEGIFTANVNEKELKSTSLKGIKRKIDAKTAASTSATPMAFKGKDVWFFSCLANSYSQSDGEKDHFFNLSISCRFSFVQ